MFKKVISFILWNTTPSLLCAALSLFHLLLAMFGDPTGTDFELTQVSIFVAAFLILLEARRMRYESDCSIEDIYDRLETIEWQNLENTKTISILVNGITTLLEETQNAKKESSQEENVQEENSQEASSKKSGSEEEVGKAKTFYLSGKEKTFYIGGQETLETD